MIDRPFAQHARTMAGPLTRAEPITPHDTNLIALESRALMVGVSGDVAVEFVDGSAVTLPALRAGIVYPMAVVKVLSTGTTATSILALA